MKLKKWMSFAFSFIMVLTLITPQVAGANNEEVPVLDPEPSKNDATFPVDHSNVEQGDIGIQNFASISFGQTIGAPSSPVSISNGQTYRVNVVNQSNSDPVYVNIIRDGTVILSSRPIEPGEIYNDYRRSVSNSSYSIQIGCVSGTNCQANGSINPE